MKKNDYNRFIALVSVLIFFLQLSTLLSLVSAEESCVYYDELGVIKSAKSRDQVPESARGKAICKKAQASRSETTMQGVPNTLLLPTEKMANPSEIELTGTVRKAEFVTSLGKVSMRWSRSAEKYFGRSPERLLVEGATAASRAIRASRFSSKFLQIPDTFEVVIIDEDLPEKQIPADLLQRCHPAWMTPPANIYIVGKRVAGGCGRGDTAEVSKEDAEDSLSKVLMHEIGHVIEYHLLGNAGGPDPVRAEGFATWFEQYSANFNSRFSKNEVRDIYKRYALEGLRLGKRGLPVIPIDQYDYALCFLLFDSLVTKHGGVSSLIRIYEAMKENNLSFSAALKIKGGVEPDKLIKEGLLS
jgi:hypothetical protein